MKVTSNHSNFLERCFIQSKAVVCLISQFNRVISKVITKIRTVHKLTKVDYGRFQVCGKITKAFRKKEPFWVCV